MRNNIQSIITLCSLLLCLNYVFATPAVEEKTAISPTKRKPPLVFFASATQPVVTVSLNANPSTGYQWYMKDTQSYLIDAVSYTYQQASEKPLIGAGGQAVWKLSLDAEAFDFPQRIDVCFLNKGPGTSPDNITKQRVWIFTSPISNNTNG